MHIQYLAFNTHFDGDQMHDTSWWNLRYLASSCIGVKKLPKSLLKTLFWNTITDRQTMLSLELLSWLKTLFDKPLMNINFSSMSSFLSIKKNKEKYELNNICEGSGGKEKDKDYGSITSLVNNEVRLLKLMQLWNFFQVLWIMYDHE